MTIREEGLPDLNGRWCGEFLSFGRFWIIFVTFIFILGSAWGYTIYYSETRSVNLSLRLDKLLQLNGGNGGGNGGGNNLGGGNGNSFDFKIIYKFVRKTDAKLR